MNYTIRAADINDLQTIVKFKKRMFEDIQMAHILSKEFIEKVEESYKEMYEKDLAKHYVAETEDGIVACTGGFIKNDIPYCYFEKPYYGFIGDVYVLPEYRRNKLATKLTEEAINWLKIKEVKTIKLLASNYGRKVYENLGFTPSDEMVLQIRE